MYTTVLERSETFFMDAHFCRLVDHARREVPDDFRYEARWLQAPWGWLWIAEPFPVPPLVVQQEDQGLSDVQWRVRAIGWRPVPPGTMTQRSPVDDHKEPATVGTTQFMCFQDPALYPQLRSRVSGLVFSSWSYFTFREGQPLRERIELFEQVSRAEDVNGAYAFQPDRAAEVTHEIRWLYTALYLMAQKLATTVPHKTDRPTRRRAERMGQQAPPFIKVITLRRLEADRAHASAGKEVDWQWQWEVRGHWRNHWYPVENTHKPVFIESYVKGPTDKPFKPSSPKLFVATR